MSNNYQPTREHIYKKSNKHMRQAYAYHEVFDRDECDLFMSLTAYLSGFAGGIILHMTPIYLPSVLNDSFAFRSTLLWKLVATLAACTTLLNAILAIARQGVTRSYNDQGIIGRMAGSLVLGAGMGMSQSDPMLLCVQLGTFTMSSVYTMIGCLIASIGWGLIYDFFPKDKTVLKPQYIDALCHGKTTYYVVAIPVALMYAGVAYGMEYLKTYTKEGPFAFQASLLYSPYAVGGLLSLMQFILMAAFCKSYQGFCTWLASLAFPINQSSRLCKANPPMFIRWTGSLSCTWSILMGIGLFFGSLAAGVFKLKNAYFIEEGSSPLFSLLGGFLMILGAIYSGSDLFNLCAGLAELNSASYLNLGMLILGAYLSTYFLGNKIY